PERHREGCTDVPEPGDLPGLKALVASESARLEAELDAGVRKYDATMREASAAGMGTEEDKETKRLRRYTTTCARALRWAQKEFDRVRAEGSPKGEMPEASVTCPEPSAAVVPAEAPVSAEEAMSEDVAEFIRQERRKFLAQLDAEAAMTPRQFWAASMSAQAPDFDTDNDTDTDTDTEVDDAPATDRPVGNRRYRKAEARRQRQAEQRPGQ